MLNSGQGGDYSIISLGSPLGSHHQPKKTAMTKQTRRMHRFESPSERSDIQDRENQKQADYTKDAKFSQANSVMIGASSIADIQSGGRLSPYTCGSNKDESMYRGTAAMNVRSVAMDSQGEVNTISSQLQSIQMDAFHNEHKGKGKSFKRMLN